jgi:hypothetical protein
MDSSHAVAEEETAQIYRWVSGMTTAKSPSLPGPHQRPKVLARRGPKPGSSHVTHSKAFWYHLCQQYTALAAADSKLTQRDFLRGPASGDAVSGSPSECTSFSRYFRLYQQGKLAPTDGRRKRASKFPALEQKLVAYVKQRASLVHSVIQGNGDDSSHSSTSRQQVGLTCAALQGQCLAWAARMENQEDVEGFVASYTWIQNCLKRHGLRAVYSSDAKNERSFAVAEVQDPPPLQPQSPPSPLQQQQQQQMQHDMPMPYADYPEADYEEGNHEDDEESHVHLSSPVVTFTQAEEILGTLRQYGTGLGMMHEELALLERFHQAMLVSFMRGGY